jgi:hypothetical protein
MQKTQLLPPGRGGEAHGMMNWLPRELYDELRCYVRWIVRKEAPPANLNLYALRDYQHPLYDQDAMPPHLVPSKLRAAVKRPF